MTLRDDLKAALLEVGKLTRAATGGKGIEDVVGQIISQHTGLPIIASGEFKRNYLEYYEIMGGQSGLYMPVYDFSAFKEKEIKSQVKRKDGFIAVQPRGSQSTPDLLVVSGYRGIPFEMKSSANGMISWNSGLPRKGFVYIYNKYAGNKNNPSGTTFFMGESRMGETMYASFASERADLQAKADTNAKLRAAVQEGSEEGTVADDALGSDIKTYVRPMYTDTIRYLSDAGRARREAAVFAFLEKVGAP